MNRPEPPTPPSRLFRPLPAAISLLRPAQAETSRVELSSGFVGGATLDGNI